MIHVLQCYRYARGGEASIWGAGGAGAAAARGEGGVEAGAEKCLAAAGSRDTVAGKAGEAYIVQCRR